MHHAFRQYVVCSTSNQAVETLMTDDRAALSIALGTGAAVSCEQIYLRGEMGLG
jgi:hypothetical protein